MATIASHDVPERHVKEARVFAHLIGFLGANLIVAPIALAFGAPSLAPSLPSTAAAVSLGVLAMAVGARKIAAARD